MPQVEVQAPTVNVQPDKTGVQYQPQASDQRPVENNLSQVNQNQIEQSVDIVDIYKQKTFKHAESQYPFTVNQILEDAFRQNASDIHLGAGNRPKFRIDGELLDTKYSVMNGNNTQEFIYQTMNKKQIHFFENEMECDFSFELPGKCRFRANVFFERGHVGAVYRIIPRKILTLEELQLPPIFKTITQKKRGLVLVTGPTGSGKSTTLAAMIDYINKNRTEHIITIEDPIEFMHKSQKSKITHREVGSDTKSFAEALKRAMRQDPDIILVGEMRDLETISLAITAAETGHLVFGTLHTSSAPKTINRIIDVFPSDEQSQIRATLSESLFAVIAQRLLPLKHGKGRVAVHEVMINILAIANLIREEKVFQIPSIMVTSKRYGMCTNDQKLHELVKQDIISEQVALLNAEDPLYLKGKLRADTFDSPTSENSK
ncbi:type IV pilus twitching motility protein PilT [bacterium]|nr:type IV pilus twitching motility protein PilT [bacterium]